VSEAVRRSSTAFKKEMTDGSPGYGESEALEDLPKIGDVLSFSPPSVSGHLRRMMPKGPTQFEIR